MGVPFIARQKPTDHQRTIRVRIHSLFRIKITSAEGNGRNEERSLSRSSSVFLQPQQPFTTQNTMDLKHVSSNSVLTSPSKSHRQLQHPRNPEQRLGSPTSIPSSPTSIRSSSSAIFERDIEPIVSPSPPLSAHHQHNPHRIPRAKTTEQLEQSVPSVLDSAATILIGMGKDDVANEVAVVSPAASILEVFDRSSGFASPIGSLRSRSPSPVGSKVGAASPRGEMLLSIPVPPQATSIVPSPASILGLQNIVPTQLPPTLSQPSAKPRPSIQTTTPNVPDTDTPTPSLIHPNPVANSTSSSRQSSPRTTTLEQFPAFIPSSQMPSQYNFMTSPPSLNSHPPSPAHFPKKRLSFMSYNDLLSSTPTTIQPLSSLTTCASAADPPPHIPSVSGLNVVSAGYSSGCASPASRAPSLRNFPFGAVGIGPIGGLTHPGKRDSIALLDNMGGEWEREGLGKGLEERLDTLILSGPPTTIPIGGKA